MTDVLLERLLRREELGPREVDRLLADLVDPRRSDIERAARLIALRAKGERVSEIVAFARALGRRAVPFPGPRRAGAVDLCGSGGAPRPSFNVGTVAALVVRAAGVPVAKHGNRSARGATGGWAGSSDLLEALGLPFLTSRAFARAAFDREGITFLHAPLFHPAVRAVGPVRRALGVPTIFNLVGPLSNPARVPFQVVGAPERATAARLAAVLQRLGVRRAVTVASDDGTDEFSARGRSRAIVVDRRSLRSRVIDPANYLESDDRRGPDGALPAHAAAEESERLLAGGGGARRGSVLLTAGMALWTVGVVPSLRAGVLRAAEALDSGAAEATLDRLRALGRSRRWPTEASP